MIILLPPISLTFSNASKPLKSSSFDVTHHLHHQHRNTVYAPPLAQPNQPYQNLSQSLVLFYIRCSSKIRFFSQKQLALPTGKTWEALQCVRKHRNAPEIVSRPFKVLTLVRSKMFELMPLYVGTYDGT